MAGTQIQFNQPVVFYVENFLHFPVGTIVPVGSFDTQKGVWMPSKNGLVIKLLSVTAGLANLDVDGNSQPATPAIIAATKTPTSACSRSCRARATFAL